MIVEFLKYEPLLTWFRNSIANRRATLLLVEGYMTSGKTHLASLLSKDLGGQHIEVDNFTLGMLDPESQAAAVRGTPYLECLHLPVLQRAIVESIESCSLTIVEGVCLRDVLSSIGIQYDLALYVRRLSSLGLWHDEFNRQDYEEGRETFKGLYRDQYEYHTRIRPHQLADVLLTRHAD